MTAIDYLAMRSGTPREIVGKLSRAVVKAMGSPAAARRYADAGASPGGSTPEELGQLLAKGRDKWRAEIARAASIWNGGESS